MKNGAMPIETWPTPPNGWPESLWSTPYVAAAVPGRGHFATWLGGSNCQSFAYGVVSLFGLVVPPLRSSELWADADATVAVEEPKCLDLVLLNSTKDSWGAHVGVWMTPDEILHLCAEVGYPTVWSQREFASRPRYETIVGYKRTTERGR